jgi:hypothetical protein
MRPDQSKCPEAVRASLARYVEHGYRPGGFLTAVLSGNLFLAFKLADNESVEAMPHIVAYIYQNLRSDCYGSKEKVAAWGGAKETQHVS